MLILGCGHRVGRRPERPRLSSHPRGQGFMGAARIPIDDGIKQRRREFLLADVYERPIRFMPHNGAVDSFTRHKHKRMRAIPPLNGCRP